MKLSRRSLVAFAAWLFLKRRGARGEEVTSIRTDSLNCQPSVC